MPGPELILTTVNCFLEQAKPKKKKRITACSLLWEEYTDNPNIHSTGEKQGVLESHDLPSDWVTRKWGLGGADSSDNHGTELQKHVALPLGHSLRNPNNWWFPMEKVPALLTVCSWPIWEAALAKITSPLISLAGGGMEPTITGGDWGEKQQLHIKEEEGNKNNQHVQYHMWFLPINPIAAVPWEQAHGSAAASEQQYVREEDGFLDAWKTGWTHGWGTSQKLLQETLPILSACLNSHIPLSHAPGSQGFPQVRNWPRAEQSEAKPARRGARPEGSGCSNCWCSASSGAQKGRKRDFSLAEEKDWKQLYSHFKNSSTLCIALRTERY